MDKWYAIACITAIIMYGGYKMMELYFDRIEILQKNSQIVIER